MDFQNLRYIVFLLNPDTSQYLSNGAKIETHEGTIFANLKEAEEHAKESIEDNLCTRFVIGYFVLDKEAQHMNISMVQTFGFKNDKKKVDQLTLF